MPRICCLQEDENTDGETIDDGVIVVIVVVVVGLATRYLSESV